MGWFILKEYIKEWFEALLQALVIVGVMFFLLWPVKIEGISMENTFFDGDRVAINRILTMAGMYDHGDFIVFEIEEDSKKIKVIKRVVGIEGDRVQIHNGNIYINGNLVEETYTKGYTYGNEDIMVPKDCVYVLGDNREKSFDSRVFGLVDKKQISGKVILKFYPIKEIKTY